MGKMQKYLAEVLGTFVLVGVGSFAIISSITAQWESWSIAFGFGLALLIGLYAFGEVSGGHFNPIVSLVMFLDRRLSLDDMIAYWIAQVVGAIIASIVVLIAYDDEAVAATTTQASDTWAAVVVEIVLSALFVAVILHSTVSERTRGTALLAIPLTLVAIHVAAIPISGASVNPARSFGPALVGTDFHDFWIYLIAPPIGAILGWMAYRVVVHGETSFRDDLDAMRRRPAPETTAGTPPPTQGPDA
jgi:aquaporin Z